MFHKVSARSEVLRLIAASIVALVFFTTWTTNSTATSAKDTVTAVANLQHTPTGTAKLYLSPDGHALTVTILLIGLAPNSVHPAHIHGGVCTNDGAILYPLNNVLADAKGQASSTTIISSKASLSIPATGWYINVHNGPTLNTPMQASPIACGNISNQNGSRSVLLFLGSTSSPNQNATGYTSLKVENGKLNVTISVEGLVPGSLHAAHIHAGNCFYTQGVLYNLSPLKADAKGNVSKTETFSGVSSIPASGWDINVHLSTDLSTQTGYDPILCGDVVR